MTLALQTRGLRKRFGRRVVIDHLDLEVPEGAVMGFLGRNGAGKTTTLRMLLGIIAPDGGEIVYQGNAVRRAGARERRSIGYVSQQQHFYPWMKVRSLGWFVGAFYPTWDGKRFDDLLKRLAVEPSQRVGALSGGTRMKLALALALAHAPPLLLLDEPTAGVDPVTRREILDLLRAVSREEGRTVLFSTHHISEIEAISDRVAVLHEGNIFWQGELEGLADRVRRVEGEPPEGARILTREGEHTLAFAEPELWGNEDRVSLEEAFVAIARQDGAL